MPKTKTISELQKELKAKQSQLKKLQSRRSNLARKLAALDRQIGALGGGAPAKATNGRKKAAKKKVPKKVVRKAKRGKPLPECIKRVLGKAEGGMRVKDIMSAVKKAGYQTTSRHFYGSVAAALREGKAFKRAGRGVYKLKGRKKAIRKTARKATPGSVARKV